MSKVCVSAAALLLVVAMLATGLGYGVDRYVAANEAVLDELPIHPGASRTSIRSSAYYDGDSAWSPVAGYTTLAFFKLPPEARPEQVSAFYERVLAPEWELKQMTTEAPFAAGPILQFRRGEEGLSVNLESWRGGVLEISIDHEGE